MGEHLTQWLGKICWKGSGQSEFAVAGPSVCLSSAPGYVVVLVGKLAVRTVPFLWFRSKCRDGEDGFGLDGVGRGSRNSFRLFGEDLL